MERIPVGFIFDPTDKEVIEYLTSKVNGEILNCDSYIHEKDLYGEGEDKNPWKIFEAVRKTRVRVRYDDDDDNDDDDDDDKAIRYFFTTLSKKYKNKRRIRRTAGSGTWTQEVGKPIVDDDEKTVIGMRKNLTFTYNKSGVKRKNTKSGSWIMHEYSLPAATNGQDNNQTDEIVLCRIRRKGAPKSDEVQTNEPTLCRIKRKEAPKSDSSSSVHPEIPPQPPSEMLLPKPAPTLHNSFSNPSGPHGSYFQPTMMANIPPQTMFDPFSNHSVPMITQSSYNSFQNLQSFNYFRPPTPRINDGGSSLSNIDITLPI